MRHCFFSIRNIIFFVVGGAAILLVGGEVAVRISGITDFPTYEASPELGYALNPNQHGRFLGKNEWFVNQKQQCTTEWMPGGKDDILLLGDSVVLGGNPLNQPDRLGSKLQKSISGSHVWPAAAGSWAVPNEIAYMNRYPEVVQDAEQLVWVLNGGDLDKASVWKSELTHPRVHPLSSLVYVWEKYVRPKLLHQPVPEAGGVPVGAQILPESIAVMREKLADIRKKSPNCRIMIVVYPAVAEELHSPPETEAYYEKFLATVRGIAAEFSIPVIEVRADPRWGPKLYRDGIHPNAMGNNILAQIIADDLR